MYIIGYGLTKNDFGVLIRPITKHMYITMDYDLVEN